MNPYLVVILVTLIGTYLLDKIAIYLNLKAMSPEVPAEFQGYCDAQKYRRAQEYTRAKAYFSVVTDTIRLVLLLTLILTGAFGWFDRMLRSWGYSSLVTGLLFFGLFSLANDIFNLPFRLYYTFVLEERFGFNRTTARTFVLDELKKYLLILLIAAPVLAAVLWFFEHAGPLAWVYCWGFVAVVMIIIQYLAPTLIMPLFNRFTPLAEGPCKQAIEELAQRADFPLQGIFVMDGSRRSAKSNAFMTGWGRNKRIVLFDTLIAQHSIPELVAILAHEIGHYRHKHILKGTLLGLAQSGLLFYLLSIFLTHQGLFAAFQVEQVSVYAGLFFFGMLYSPVALLLSIATSWLSRQYEYQADRFEVELTGDKKAAINALKKMATAHLSNLTPHPFYVMLNYSHPPDLERIRAMQAIPLP